MRNEARAEDGEVRSEYDFATARKNPYAEQANRPTNIVVIDPDLFEIFPSSDAVNKALRKIAAESTKTEQHAKAS